VDNLAILKQAEAAYLMRRGEEEAAFAAAIDLAQLARSLQELDAWPSSTTALCKSSSAPRRRWWIC